MREHCGAKSEYEKALDADISAGFRTVVARQYATVQQTHDIVHDLRDAYALASEADDCINEGRHDDAARLFERARALAPDNHELLFWAGLGAAHAGDVDGGVQDVRAAIELQPGWRELLERMPPEVAPSAAVVLERLRESA